MNGRGIVTKPGRSGASTMYDGWPDPPVDERGWQLLKYDSTGPVYVPPAQFRAIMGEPKHRTGNQRRKKSWGKSKKR